MEKKEEEIPLFILGGKSYYLDPPKKIMPVWQIITVISAVLAVMCLVFILVAKFTSPS